MRAVHLFEEGLARIRAHAAAHGHLVLCGKGGARFIRREPGWWPAQ